jgi:hypothetical protein
MANVGREEIRSFVGWLAHRRLRHTRRRPHLKVDWPVHDPARTPNRG